MHQAIVKVQDLRPGDNWTESLNTKNAVIYVVYKNTVYNDNFRLIEVVGVRDGTVSYSDEFPMLNTSIMHVLRPE
jgi:hypothetical protein